MGTADVRDQLQATLGTTYSLERELGHGGMATVYLAQDTKHHRAVALKVLHTDLAASLGPERFRREIKLAAGLQHPHIVSVYDSGATPGGQLWFTMPYVEGESLRARLDREKQLPLDDALKITREVADALDYAHQQGIIHRDVKPENILLSRGHALVADFGVARAISASEGNAGAAGETLTEIGMALGTPTYMSPEQATGERTLDARTDVYALGCVLYEMLTGEPPYTGATAQVILAKRISGEVPSVRRARPTVPAAVDAAIRKALAPVPADRFVSTADFGRALDAGERSAITRGLDVVAAGRPGRRVPTGVALLGLGFLVGVGALFAWRRHVGAAPVAVAAGPVGLAVLPFDNEGDTANAYFAAGITDEIRSKLSALPALRLIASTSSNQYRRTQKPAEQIGRELGVRYLLTGRVQWEQGANGTRRVRVSPELVEVRDGAAPETKWQQSYDTTLADVFDVQSAVATRVADKLGLVLNAPAQAQLASRPTQNLAAYDAYLRSTTRVGAGPMTARLVSAEQAVALDSTFAEAWALVSELHTGAYVNSAVPAQADADAARRAAERAVALAPTAPEGYVARGFYNFGIAYDMATARAAYETAVRLAPSSSEATGGLALADASVGRWEAALGNARQAVALDPRSVGAAENLSQILLWVRRYPEASAAASRGLTLAPANLQLVLNRAVSRLGTGDLAGARATLRDVPPAFDRGALAAYMAKFGDLYWALDSADHALLVMLPPSRFDDRSSWGLVRAELYWLAGDTVRARRYADSARLAFETQHGVAPNNFAPHLFHGLMLAYVGQRAEAVREGEHGLALAMATADEYFIIPYARHLLAQLYVAVGDHPHALDQLEALLAKPYPISPAWLKIDPTWAPLRGDARFERLIAQPLAGALPAP